VLVHVSQNGVYFGNISPNLLANVGLAVLVLLTSAIAAIECDVGYLNRSVNPEVIFILGLSDDLASAEVVERLTRIICSFACIPLGPSSELGSLDITYGNEELAYWRRPDALVDSITDVFNGVGDSGNSKRESHHWFNIRVVDGDQRLTHFNSSLVNLRNCPVDNAIL